MVVRAEPPHPAAGGGLRGHPDAWLVFELEKRGTVGFYFEIYVVMLTTGLMKINKQNTYMLMYSSPLAGKLHLFFKICQIYINDTECII